MSLPDEKYRAIINAREFLRDLLTPSVTPKVPRKIRIRAYYCLKHYPSEYEFNIVGYKKEKTKK